MIKKTSLIFIFLLVVSISFVSSANFPAPFVDNVVDNVAVVYNTGTRDTNKEICGFMKGCFIENECYPFGYIKGNLSCSRSELYPHVYVSAFINQSKSGENCVYDFQCESNFCFNGECVGEIKSLILDVIQKISLLEDNFDTLKINMVELENIPEEEDKVEQIEENPKRFTGFFVKVFG